MITVKEVEHLAQLARIELDESEKEGLTRDIDSILSYVDELKKATVNLDYSPTPGVLYNVTRKDESHVSLDRDRVLAESPDREGEFVAVKKIIEQD